MSSTALEFGLISTFRTHNLLLDTLLCMLVPFVIQKAVAHLHQSPGSVLGMLHSWLFGVRDDLMVTRTIEITQRFNQYGKIWDFEQKNHLLQKAISLYLADRLDLDNKNAVYELMEADKNKKKNKKKASDSDDEAAMDSSLTDTSSSYSDDNDNNDDVSEVCKLSLEAMPSVNEWVEVEPGVDFMHATEAPENPGDSNSKSVKTNKIVFKFQSKLIDGSDRIDAFIAKAYDNYQRMERQKHIEDKSRYFYIQSGMKTSGDKAMSSVAYKRYALGEEKTFDNLFFHDKQQVMNLLDNFTNRTSKFAIKGFPYKLGLLLHGPPGTGKTSLIKAVAQHTKRHIVTISLGKIKTNQELLDALFDMKFAVEGMDTPIEMSFKDVVFVMEDIDCASSVVNARGESQSQQEERKTSMDAGTDAMPPLMKESDDEKLMSAMMKLCVEDEKKYAQQNDQLSLSGLLNVLDGVIDCPGRIVIMTTNHPEKLDPALIRPGRVNKKLLLSYIGVEQIIQMVEYYSSTTLSGAQRDVLEKAFPMTPTPFTPAEVEEICAEYDDVDAVIEGLLKMAQE